MSNASQAPRARLLWLVMLVLLVPIIPLALVGDAWAQPLFDRFAAGPPSRPIALTAFLVLAADILLPVPSGPLTVLLAASLGFWQSLAIGVAGLTVGGVFGYVFAAIGGHRVASWLVDARELEKWQAFFQRDGGWVVLLSRPVPIVAEAVVLSAGLGKMQIWKFVLTLAVGNTVVVVVYSLLGAYAAQFEMAFTAAAAVALFSLASFRVAFQKRDQNPIANSGMDNTDIE